MIWCYGFWWSWVGQALHSKWAAVDGVLASVIKVRNTSSSCWVPCSRGRTERTDLTDLIILSQIPPICYAAETFMFKCIKWQSLARRNSLTRAWSSSCTAAASSFLAPTMSETGPVPVDWQNVTTGLCNRSKITMWYAVNREAWDFLEYFPRELQ